MPLPPLGASWHHPPSPRSPPVSSPSPGGSAEAVTSPGCLSLPSCCITTAASSSSSTSDRGDRKPTANSLRNIPLWTLQRSATSKHGGDLQELVAVRQPRSSCWDMARPEQVLLLEPQHELKFRGRRGEGPTLNGRGSRLCQRS